MRLTIRYGNLTLADPSLDVVSGVRLGGESSVERVRLVRRDRARCVPRGGQLDTQTFRLERQHDSVVAAYTHLVERRRKLRALNLTPGLTVEIRADYERPYVCKYTSAVIEPGESYQQGVRTFETFTLTGALADTL